MVDSPRSLKGPWRIQLTAGTVKPWGVPRLSRGFTYLIIDGALLAGKLPPNKHKLVVAWIEIHQEDLLADWSLAVNGKKPFPIKGLDQ